MFLKQTIKDVVLINKTVLLRVDYNVPLREGRITDDNRIIATKKTIQDLLDNQVKRIIIISHLGRPKLLDLSLSLRPVATHLEQILGQSVEFISDWSAIKQSSSKIILMENLRFDPREAANSIELAEQIVEASGADLFIQDGFAVCHRQSVTTDTVTKLLPSIASNRLAQEYQKVITFLDNNKLKVAIVGGAKISDKINFIKKLISQVDYMIIGGAMANTFLLANGTQVGRSLVETNQLQTVIEIKRLWLQQHQDLSGLIIPIDVKVTIDLNSNNSVIKTTSEVSEQDIIADLGPQTINKISQIIDLAEVILWNGNLGYTENPEFAIATETVVKELMSAEKDILIGGGDTVGFVKNIVSVVNNSQLYLSTGGGAMLELIANKRLIGVDSLLDRPLSLD